MRCQRRLVVELLEDRIVLNVDLRIVTYNITEAGHAAMTNPALANEIQTVLQAIGDETAGDGIARPIDIIALQEVSKSGDDAIEVAKLLNNIDPSGDYMPVTVFGDSRGAGTQMLVYRSTSVSIVKDSNGNDATVIGNYDTTDSSEPPRKTLRYEFNVLGTSTTQTLYIYNSHLQASPDNIDKTRRQIEADAIRSDADSLGPNANIIYLGDYNTYSSSDPAYQEFLSSGNGQAFDEDPLGGQAWLDDKVAFSRMYTQSPKVSINSRFDFQLMSNALHDGQGLDYIPNSYHPFGNDGSLFEKPITDSTTLPTAVKTALAYFTDHLPLAADYEVIESTGSNAGVTVSKTSAAVTEGSLTDTYSMVLDTQPTSDVTIAVNTGGQLVASPSSLVFTTSNWNVSQNVTISAVDDKAVEGARVQTIMHSVTSADLAYNGIPVSSVDVSITDNDQAGLAISAAQLTVDEGDSQTYMVALTATPSSDVTVTLAPGPQVTVIPSSLIFTPANWNTPQSVTVTAIDNSVADGTRSDSISHTTASADLNFNGLPPSSLPITILDDEGFLKILGTASTDTITVLCSTKTIQVVENRKATIYPATYQRIVIKAGAGNDVIKLVNPLVDVDIQGGAGNHQVQLSGQTAANNFAVNGSTVTLNGHTVTFSNIQNVVLQGSGAADTFAVQTMPGFAVSLQGGGGLDQLIGPAGGGSWAITGSNAGTLDKTVAFSAIENLLGGAGDDTFVFGAGKAMSGRIDGGLGNNTINLSAYKTPISANLQTKTITGTRGFDNIENIIGGAGTDKIIGKDVTTFWDLIGVDAGQINGVDGTSYSFSGIESIAGGAADDTFVMSNSGLRKGKIDGGKGNNTLDYSNYSADVTIDQKKKTATGTPGWLNIEQFIGGDGAFMVK